MKNLTSFCLMAFIILMAISFDSAALNNSTKPFNNNELKKENKAELRCCEGWFVDYNDCGVLILSTVTKCTYNDNIPIEKVCEAANNQAMKNFTYACESEGPKN